MVEEDFLMLTETSVFVVMTHPCQDLVPDMELVALMTSQDNLLIYTWLKPCAGHSELCGMVSPGSGLYL